jgi:hypothetical protein
MQNGSRGEFEEPSMAMIIKVSRTIGLIITHIILVT